MERTNTNEAELAKATKITSLITTVETKETKAKIKAKEAKELIITNQDKKSFNIPIEKIEQAFNLVKANKGSAGVDSQSIEDFEKDYIRLKAPIQETNGTIINKTEPKGTPQGGVISPLLANLYLHYTLDLYLQINCPTIPFERYADDGIYHCKTEKQAKFLLQIIETRLKECGLELNKSKTKIVYCKDSSRKQDYVNKEMNFLGYTFRAREAINKNQEDKGNKVFSGFLPAIGDSSKAKIRETIRKWNLPRGENTKTIEDIAKRINPIVSGWINYYGVFYKTELMKILSYLDMTLARWVKRKYKRYSRKYSEALKWIRRLSIKEPNLFAHWRYINNFRRNNNANF